MMLVEGAQESNGAEGVVVVRLAGGCALRLCQKASDPLTKCPDASTSCVMALADITLRFTTTTELLIVRH